MLMNHKNFHFEQMLDKTNDVIILKSKNHVSMPFLTIFVIFPDRDFFPKHPAVTHNYIWTPNTMLSFRKN